MEESENAKKIHEHVHIVQFPKKIKYCFFNISISNFMNLILY